MNNLLYARLAKTNLSKNRQNILPYLLSCIGTVVMFFIMDTLAQGSGFDSMIGKDTILTVMGMGTYIIGLFAVIFLIYSNSFLAKRRKKEFGLFQILGMEKKHLAKILFFESLYLWAASLGIGILLGVLLYRLLFLVLMKLTGLNGTIGFAFSAKAVGSTMLLFGLTFVINFLLSLRQIHVSQPVELLHGGAQGEREPKTKLLTAVLGFMLLGVGYYLALTCQSSMDALDKFFNAIALVMVGTYCLFSAGSIAFLKILKKNKNYYYQTRHFTSISGMLYRMKQNAVGLANICIEYATKRYRSNCVNWGILPFTCPEAEINLEPGEYLYLPGIRKAVEDGATKFTAKVIGKDGAVRDLELDLNGVTEAEKKVLLAGSLINSYKE